jgi:8-hydroxy-5-deazaflavin:NADPH oxidoreductase
VRVTLIGAGKMGRALGTRLVAGGHDVELLDRDPGEAQRVAGEIGATAVESVGDGDVAVLALYYPGTLDAADQYRDVLAGKIVVDICNPVDTQTWDRLATPPDTAAAEELAARLPESRVVKAFNTTFGNTLLAGEVAGQQLDVLIAGDDGDAKRAVASLAESGGLRPIDVGPLERARQLEQLGFLHISLQEALGSGFGSAVKFHW